MNQPTNPPTNDAVYSYLASNLMGCMAVPNHDRYRGEYESQERKTPPPNLDLLCEQRRKEPGKRDGGAARAREDEEAPVIFFFFFIIVIIAFSVVLPFKF